ncbi:hypothetical protein DITRI_Ditri08aG0117900 [Diplodiscus trichospermus]
MDDYSLCRPRLKTLQIIGCRSLKYVLPITLAQGLPYLESIEIVDCSRLKRVFNMTKEKGEHPQQPIVLQRLRTFNFQNLETFSSFCPKNFDMSLSLKEFKVHNCPQLTRFVNLQEVALQVESKGLPCNAKMLTMDRVMYHKNLIPNVYSEGLNEIAFLAIEHGKGLECLIDTTDQGHVSAGISQKLEELEICDCKELISLTPALQNLKKVRIINCVQLQQVLHTEELLHDMEENKAPVLSNLTSLEPKSSPFLAQSLEQLEELFIENCEGLEHIISTEPDGGHPHLPVFPNLTSFKINRCPCLKYVFKIDLDKGLPHLKSLSITDASQLKQVFINVAKPKNEVGHGLRSLSYDICNLKS